MELVSLRDSMSLDSTFLGVTVKPRARSRFQREGNTERKEESGKETVPAYYYPTYIYIYLCIRETPFFTNKKRPGSRCQRAIFPISESPPESMESYRYFSFLDPLSSNIAFLLNSMKKALFRSNSIIKAIKEIF